MKLIFTKDVPGTARAGDVKEISDGHARNYLIPRHLAMPATTETLARVQKEEAEKQAKISKTLEKFNALKGKLESKTFTIFGKAAKDHLFAAIHTDQIAQAINDKLNLNINSDQIFINVPIKSIGLHTVEIRFAKDHKSLVKLNVEAS